MYADALQALPPSHTERESTLQFLFLLLKRKLQLIPVLAAKLFLALNLFDALRRRRDLFGWRATQFIDNEFSHLAPNSKVRSIRPLFPFDFFPLQRSICLGGAKILSASSSEFIQLEISSPGSNFFKA